jgi:hypothetical protein
MFCKPSFCSVIVKNRSSRIRLVQYSWEYNEATQNFTLKVNNKKTFRGLGVMRVAYRPNINMDSKKI